LRFSNSVYVREVLKHSRCLLLGYEVIGGNEISLKAGFLVNHVLNAPLPCPSNSMPGIFVKMSTPIGSRPTRKERAGLGEVDGGQTFKQCAEFGQSRKTRLRVICIGSYENVEVLSRPWLRVNGDGVSA
jgi:hypothetical protein